VPSAPSPGSWAWLSPGAAPALATCNLGVILRAYRRARSLTQQQLAAQLGYDPSYISMLERGRRTISDRGTLACIARKLSIPPHIFGVTDQDDADFLAMI
jgi:transcriptional regulator with XRE-family HTH domain